jgi:hypothetical protein
MNYVRLARLRELLAMLDSGLIETQEAEEEILLAFDDVKKKKNCANCQHYKIGEYKEPALGKNEDISGHCRRYAPIMLSGTGTGWSDQLFPRVDDNYWCGEFTPVLWEVEP